MKRFSPWSTCPGNVSPTAVPGSVRTLFQFLSTFKQECFSGQWLMLFPREPAGRRTVGWRRDRTALSEEWFIMYMDGHFTYFASYTSYIYKFSHKMEICSLPVVARPRHILEFHDALERCRHRESLLLDPCRSHALPHTNHTSYISKTWRRDF